MTDKPMRCVLVEERTGTRWPVLMLRFHYAGKVSEIEVQQPVGAAQWHDGGCLGNGWRLDWEG